MKKCKIPVVKHSIKKQYALIFGLLLAGLVILICVINGLVLSTFYVHHKRKVLTSAYAQIDTAAESDKLGDDSFKNDLRRLASMNNLDILILNQDLETVVSTSPDSKRLSNRLMDYVFGSSEDTEYTEHIYEGDDYYMLMTKDPRMNLEFIEMWGILSNGYLISMRSPIESIKDSAVVANELMVIVGTISVLCGICIIRLISSRITRPIMNLVGISERMTHLDFDAKYVGSSENEIDVLGEHINQLSGALEQTISDLKSANLELQKDIEQKTEEEERRKEFIANVSHELKTPIALVQGYAEGLKDCVNDDPESRDFYCDVIIDEADRMNKLVRNLLELDQLESGMDKAVMERFDIIEVIYNCASSMDLLIKQNDIELVLPEKSPIMVWADEFKVEQIVNNYLSNAIHHADGEKIVKITCEVKDDIAHIAVYNTGNPIPQESIAQLWNKFYKVDKARTRAYGGSGIGLSIVKAIMEQLEQKYGVENHEDGVEFYFELDASNSLPGSDNSKQMLQ